MGFVWSLQMLKNFISSVIRVRVSVSVIIDLMIWDFVLFCLVAEKMWEFWLFATPGEKKQETETAKSFCVIFVHYVCCGTKHGFLFFPFW